LKYFEKDLPALPLRREVTLCGPSSIQHVEGEYKKRANSSGNLFSENEEFASMEISSSQDIVQSNNSSHAHIPEYLPAFPDKHTYQFTAVYPNMNQDINSRRKQLIKQKRQVESALVKLDHAQKIPQDEFEAPFGAPK
jgi:hypothetical protein